MDTNQQHLHDILCMTARKHGVLSFVFGSVEDTIAKFVEDPAQAHTILPHVDIAQIIAIVDIVCSVVTPVCAIVKTLP